MRSGSHEATLGWTREIARFAFDDLVADLESHYRSEGMTTFADDVATRRRLHLKAVFENVPAHALQISRIKKYKADRLAEKDKPTVATVNRELQVIRKAFKLAAEHEPPKWLVCQSSGSSLKTTLA